MRFFTACFLLCSSYAVFAQPSAKNENINSNQASETKLKKIGKKEKGKQIYQRYCVTCHESGLAGAPKFNNSADWKPRLVNRKLKDLVLSSIKGINAMPSKGTCIECSNEDLEAAIIYMKPK